jgi:hypothetical protein
LIGYEQATAKTVLGKTERGPDDFPEHRGNLFFDRTLGDRTPQASAVPLPKIPASEFCPTNPRSPVGIAVTTGKNSCAYRSAGVAFAQR